MKEIGSCEDRKSSITTIGQLLTVEAVHDLMETKSLLQIKRLKEKQLSMKDVKPKDFVNSIAALDIVKTV